MCEMSKLMNETVIGPELTCNLEGTLPDFPQVPPNMDGVGQMGVGRHRISCALRKQVFDSQRATWGQIEREYNQEDLGCKDSFMYGTMLRKPWKLMVSTLGYNKWHPDRLIPWLKAATQIQVCPARVLADIKGTKHLAGRCSTISSLVASTAMTDGLRPPDTLTQKMSKMRRSASGTWRS